jgi:hypothetical protein
VDGRSNCNEEGGAVFSIGGVDDPKLDGGMKADAGVGWIDELGGYGAETFGPA